VAATLHADLTYSYRRLSAVIVAPGSESATLARVEQLLVDAAVAYRARRYGDAIAGYLEARRLLWSQLFPTARLDENRAWSTPLYRSLVSYGGEWLNVLPVEQPTAGVRPREVAALDTGPALGLLSASVSGQGSQAAADLQTAGVLRALGNIASADFFQDRAEQLAPDFVKALAPSDAAAETPGAGPAAGPAAAGAGAVLSTGTIGTAAGTHVSGPFSHVGAGITVEPSVLGSITDRREVTPLGALSRRSVIGERAGAVLVDLSTAAPVVEIPSQLTVASRTYAFRLGDAVQQVQWTAGTAPAVDTLLASVYDARRSLTVLPDVLLDPQRPADVAVGAPHAWYYETPLGLAECYHAVGDWAAAETWYLRAASYDYLNAAVEAPYVWRRLAGLYLDWGDALFRGDDPAAALPVYEKVLTADSHEPASPLYTIIGLKPGADVARQVIAALPDPTGLAGHPEITAVVLDVAAQLAKIAGGLDYWGHWAQNVPIWTFDYLQSVATNFCQLAIGAERDAMTFWEKADAGQLTRLQLTQNVTLARAERDAAHRQVDAAGAELAAYQAGVDVARLRAADARANATEYEQKSWEWTLHQGLSQQLSGGDDGDARQLNRLADRMMQGGYSIEGDRGTLAAAEGLTASRIQRQYEIDSMRRQANELDAAAAQAQQEAAAGAARVAAAQASARAADVRVEGAAELVDAFDQQRFTPDVWDALGRRMQQLSQRYLAMALDVAKRMQRAYNFENDVLRAIVKPDYASDAVRGFLAADALMADIQSFTYDQVTSTAPKAQPVRQTISLAQRHPFLFETQLRTTGRLEFQTTLDDFDGRYPGTYAGRIEHVEVAIDGIVPARGVSGTLSNAGISHYRLPAAASPPDATALKHRVQSRETLVLSDYDVRADALVVGADPRRRRVFEGAGVASAWTLELPRDVNELDYKALVDVRLTFTYEARYDPDLRAGVLAELAARPQAHERQRPFPLRWLFPDTFFSFYSSGVLGFALGQGDFAAMERDPVTNGLSLLVSTTPSSRAAGVVLLVGAPGKAPVTVTTGAYGTVAADALAAAVGGPAIGDYRVELDAADNPAWVVNGTLALDAVDNVALVLSYSFTAR
jgi:hypothetical protein